MIDAIDNTIAALRGNLNSKWIIAFSGGKDSTATLKIFLAAAKRAQLFDIKASIVYCDTGVENPIIDTYVKSTLDKIGREVSNLFKNIDIRILKAPLVDSFFVRIIGRGYTPPTNNFRWCTKNLRINPVSKYIRECSIGDAIVVLGVRKDESIQRSRSIENTQDSYWHKSREAQDGRLFMPIINMSVAEVWDTIFWLNYPNSINPSTLEQIYRDASGECPVIRSPESPPCASGRFGCWTCTVVKKDRSALKLIESGYSDLKPFLEFRNWLSEIRNDPEKRWKSRRNGSIGLGPFTLDARREILSRIDKLERISGREIISIEERGVIASLWTMDQAPRLSFKVDSPSTSA